MSLKWKPTSIGHVLQTDTVHTATSAFASGHGNVFGSVLRNASDYMTSLVTTDPVQMDLLCAAVVIPATVLLLRRITRDLNPMNNISLKDKIIIQKQIETSTLTTPEQCKRIGELATKLKIDINAYAKEMLGMEMPKGLRGLTRREGEIVESAISRMSNASGSSIREIDQIG